MIEQTEALVSIDVNGGHCMLGEGTSQEKAILDVNLAAAKQVLKSQSCHYLALACYIIGQGSFRVYLFFNVYLLDVAKAILNCIFILDLINVLSWTYSE